MANIENNWGSEKTTFGGDASKQNKKINEEIVNSKAVIHQPMVNPNHEVIFENPWLTVKKNGHYIYSERKGVDSVAFILIAINAADERRIGVIHELKPPLDTFINTAFGGSIDDEKYHKDLRILVKDEAIEEAGFDVSLDNIHYHGKVLVSTQSNQFCHLFSIEVDKMTQGDRTTTNPAELQSGVTWLTMKEIQTIEDWKTQTIILRRMMAKNGMVYVSTPKF